MSGSSCLGTVLGLYITVNCLHGQQLALPSPLLYCCWVILSGWTCLGYLVSAPAFTLFNINLTQFGPLFALVVPLLFRWPPAVRITSSCPQPSWVIPTPQPCPVGELELDQTEASWELTRKWINFLLLIMVIPSPKNVVSYVTCYFRFETKTQTVSNEYFLPVGLRRLFVSMLYVSVNFAFFFSL